MNRATSEQLKQQLYRDTAVFNARIEDFKIRAAHNVVKLSPDIRPCIAETRLCLNELFCKLYIKVSEVRTKC